MSIKIGRRRQAFIMVSRRLSNTWRRLSALCYPLERFRLNRGITLDRIGDRRTLKADRPATGRLHGDTDRFSSTYSLGHDPYRGLIGASVDAGTAPGREPSSLGSRSDAPLSCWRWRTSASVVGRAALRWIAGSRPHTTTQARTLRVAGNVVGTSQKPHHVRSVFSRGVINPRIASRILRTFATVLMPDRIVEVDGN